MHAARGGRYPDSKNCDAGREPTYVGSCRVASARERSREALSRLAAVVCCVAPPQPSLPVRPRVGRRERASDVALLATGRPGRARLHPVRGCVSAGHGLRAAARREGRGAAGPDRVELYVPYCNTDTVRGTKLGGPALLVIIFTAVIANFNLIPSASNSINLYDIIFKYVAPISIFYLLLNINISSIKKAGLPMIGLFILGSLATTFGILVSWFILSPEIILGEDAKIIAGMLTGTYTGGSVNFNAIALEYDFQKKGVLYAGTIAVDNVVTTIWIMITLTIPMILKNLWKSNISIIINSKNKHQDSHFDSIDFESLI